MDSSRQYYVRMSIGGPEKGPYTAATIAKSYAEKRLRGDADAIPADHVGPPTTVEAIVKALKTGQLEVEPSVPLSEPEEHKAWAVLRILRGTVLIAGGGALILSFAASDRNGAMSSVGLLPAVAAIVLGVWFFVKSNRQLKTRR